MALAGEADRTAVLKLIREYLKSDQRVFVGVISPIDPRIETPEEVRDRVLEAARFIPVSQLGTTDDCGFASFCLADTVTSSLYPSLWLSLFPSTYVCCAYSPVSVDLQYHQH